MPRHREGDSPGYRRRRADSEPSPPEPYQERRSEGQRRAGSRGGGSRSRERYNHRRRHSRSQGRDREDRSRSPRRRRRGDYGADVDKHRSRPQYDEDEDNRSKRRRVSSPQPRTRYLKQEEEKSNPVKGSRALPSQQDAFTGKGTETPPLEKQKPNMSTTGRLAAESNTIKASDGQAIVLKYQEPPEARKPAPSQAWRMYVFKGEDIMDTVELNQRSCWLFGREAAVVDLMVEHPSCSKQHAVVQFRYVEKRNEFGDKAGKVKPYLIDLESANGTSMNDERIPPGRYLELRDKDTLKFGYSTREYVLQLPP